MITMTLIRTTNPKIQNEFLESTMMTLDMLELGALPQDELSVKWYGHNKSANFWEINNDSLEGSRGFYCRPVHIVKQKNRFTMYTEHHSYEFVLRR